MNKFTKNLSVSILGFSLLATPITVLAKEQPKYDQWIINQATLNIQDKQAENERKLWDSYNADQKYNITYKKYVDKLAEYNKKITALRATVDANPSKLINDDVDTLKYQISEMNREISAIPLGEKSGDSKLYLEKSCTQLGTVAEKLGWYSFYKCVKAGETEQIKKATKELDDAVKTFTGYFSNCYNYSFITQNNGFNATEVTMANSDLYKFTKEYTENFTKCYNDLDSAYKALKKGKAQYDLLTSANANISKPGYFNGFTSNEAIVSKIVATANSAEEAYKALERYNIDVMTGDKANDEPFKEKFSTFKTKLDGLKAELANLEQKNSKLQSTVDQSMDKAKAAERQLLEDKGFNSMEEYQKFLKDQQKSVTQQQIAAEAEKISAEMKRQQEERKAEIEAAHKKWLDERIDFSKGQANQNHDKSFYMTKVQKNLKKAYLNNTYIGTILMEKQSEAYDAMWTIVNNGNANLDLLQQLYDQYPNDFINIVFFYTMK